LKNSILLSFFLLISGIVFGQNRKVSPQKDIMDIIGGVLNKGTSKAKNPLKPQFSALPAAGYAMHTGWGGIIAANLAFYTDTLEADKKVSTISTNFTYTQYRQAILPLIANIWTKGNRFNINIDNRFIKYPSFIYNIGKGSLNSSGYRVDYKGLKLHQTVFASLRKDLYLGLGYYYDGIWDVNEMDAPAGVVTSFQSYGYEKKVAASGPVFRLLHDSRLNTLNAQNGWYGNITYRPVLQSLGSGSNWQLLQLEARKYLHFPRGSKNILALWSHNWFTLSGKPPFLMLPSNGWDDSYNSGRGYIQGRFRDKNMVYMESEYRFGITPNGLIGAVVFANLQNYSSSMFKGYQGWIPGGGVGLRIKVNKQSGTNVCIDYGFGRDGSRGFAVNLGELF
jgi:hypothetical protein